MKKTYILLIGLFAYSNSPNYLTEHGITTKEEQVTPNLIIMKCAPQSPNQSNRPENELGKIQAIIIHYTVSDNMRTFDIFYRPDSVSAHYVIIPDGMIYSIVDNKNRAWHAGVSAWRNIECDRNPANGNSRGLNSSSIGIEIVCKGYIEQSDGKIQWVPFSPEQLASAAKLAKYLQQKYDVPDCNMIGHNDITYRKIDPGMLFPWKDLNIGAQITSEDEVKYLDESFVSLMKNEQPKTKTLLELLMSYGYHDIDLNTKCEINNKIILNFLCHLVQISDLPINNNLTYDLPEELLIKAIQTAYILVAKYPIK